MSEALAITYKSRALAGLSAQEQQDLLAAAGLMGLSSPDDPFWIYAAIVTESKALIAEVKRDSSESRDATKKLLLEASRVSSALQPAADVAVSHIRATVDAALSNLTQAAAAEIGKRVSIEAAKIADKKSKSGRSIYRAVGFAAGSVATSIAFVVGEFFGSRGVPVLSLPGPINDVGVSGLIVAQFIVVGCLALFLLANKE